jgi:hypothetical protein
MLIVGFLSGLFWSFFPNFSTTSTTTEGISCAREKIYQTHLQAFCGGSQSFFQFFTTVHHKKTKERPQVEGFSPSNLFLCYFALFDVRVCNAVPYSHLPHFSWDFHSNDSGGWRGTG